MAFTKDHAKIAAGMLSDDASRILGCFAGRGKADDISLDALKELQTLGFIKEELNLINNENVFVLTPNGKKVAKEL